MDAPKKMKILLLTLACLVSAISCGAQCHDGCSNAVTVSAALSLSASSLVGATVTLCKNSSCTQGAFPTSSNQSALSGGFAAECSAEAGSAGTVVSVQITGGNDYVDGDQYELKITGSAGTSLFDESAPATYITKDVCETDCQTLDLMLPS